MATKKQSEAVTGEATVTAAEVTETTETTQTADTTENTAYAVEAKKSWCYIGPSIPGGKLKNNTLLRGTRTEVETYFAEVLRLYPEAKQLIVDTDNLASARYELRQKRGFLYNCKQQVESRVRAALMAG